MAPSNNFRIPFSFPRLGEFAHASVARALGLFAKGEEDSGFSRVVAIDGTCGNGFDTCFLANTLEASFPLGNWVLLAFDVQDQAMGNTTAALQTVDYSGCVKLIHDSHARAAERISCEKDVLAIAMYNLGYLPRSDKSVITRSDSTLASLEGVAGRMAPGGLISVHSYGGHADGEKEMDAVDAWFGTLAPDIWCVAKYAMHNKTHNPEALYLAQHRI